MIAHDDDLPNLMELVLGLVDGAMPDGEEDEMTQRFILERITCDMPVELHVRTGETLHVVASPPTQKFETSVLPVWHRMRITVAEYDAG
jgi:hypothetical protein